MRYAVLTLLMLAAQAGANPLSYGEDWDAGPNEELMFQVAGWLFFGGCAIACARDRQWGEASVYVAVCVGFYLVPLITIALCIGAFVWFMVMIGRR